MKKKYANIIINSKADILSGSFSYDIPENLQDGLRIGQLITVPFGRRMEFGVVQNIVGQLPADYHFQIKSIDSIVFLEPILSSNQIKLSEFIAEYYHCSLGQATFAMIPGFVTSSIEKTYLIQNNKKGFILTPKQKEIYHFIDLQKNQIAEAEITKKFGSSAITILKNLVKQKVLHIHYQLAMPKIKQKQTEILSINFPAVTDDVLRQLQKKPRQWEIYLYLEENPNTSWLELKKALKISKSSLNSLVQQKIINIEKQRFFRNPINTDCELNSLPSLFPLQQNIVDQVINNFEENNKPYLIFGRTGSGKTEIYLRLTEYALSKGKDVIVLVPEISLVPQTMQRFYERFGEQMAMYHSQMSLGEKYDQWSRMRDGHAKIVIGSRSALFSPLKNLGLIIIDEEHESSFKQDSTPRYHAVTVAEEYCRLLSAQLVIGSATPRLEAFWKAKKNIHHLFTIGQTVPEMISAEHTRKTEFHLVDLRDEYAAKNYSLLSYTLQLEIAAALQNKKQILLFLNRRGHASYVFCRECGYVARCPNCQISLTQHIYQNNHRLICHHCGFVIASPTECPDCSSKAIKYYGAGTQKLEEEIKLMFPQARLLRMDHDTTRTKNAHGQIFNQFKNYEADILIGTQMIAKGWDIPNVDLAGIINADAAFHLPDFRSTERNFSLLLQLIGRVGRHGGVGKIVLQTFEKENPLWEILRKEDYQLFAFSELLERQKNNFPPFCQLVRLIFEHPENLICQRESLALFKKLNEQFAMQTANDLVEIMGPSPCFFERLHNKYRWHIILKGKNLRQFIKLASKDWIVDVDPYSIL